MVRLAGFFISERSNMDYSIKEADLTNGKALIYKGGPAKYVGRSSTGAFVVEMPMTRNERGAPEFCFKSAWPFELTVPNHG